MKILKFDSIFYSFVILAIFALIVQNPKNTTKW